MKKINPYLLAFFMVLAKSLAFSMSWQEVVVLSGLLIKLGFDSYLSVAFSKEDLAPLEAKIKQTSDSLAALQNKINFSTFRK